MSVDGKIATAARRQTKLSGDADTARVHRLRAEHDAILVGIGTILADDPKLTVKWDLAELPQGAPPLRVILDTRGRTPDAAAAFSQPGATLVATGIACGRTWPNAEVFRAGDDRVDLHALLEELSRRGVRRVLVEGGSAVIWSFLRGGFADALKVFVGSVVLGGESAPSLAGGEGGTGLEDAIRLRLEGLRTADGGVLLEYEVLR
jgi:2,5-diamino-6-(ribosylamino)-4(3H)-pyrimidinone 5'-phosphate reductase